MSRKNAKDKDREPVLEQEEVTVDATDGDEETLSDASSGETTEMIELSRHQRLQADFENYKRRSRTEMESMACYGKEQVMVDLLPVMDNFARALSHCSDNPEVATFRKGMEMIYRQLDEALRRHGLSPIEALGQPFDPQCHEAIMQVEADCPRDDNRVLDDLQTGYRLKEKVIRPSMVKVGTHSGTPDDENDEPK